VAATPSGSSEGFLDLRLPEALRAELSRPLGPVLSGDDVPARLARLARFATCGDVVTRDALSWGFVPYVAVVDGRTLRQERADYTHIPFPRAGRVLRVRNPPGFLTAALQEAVRDLVRGGGGLLWVEGEEDLAALSLCREMEESTTVIYGQPGEGVCFVTVDSTVKARVEELLHRMETPHGHQDRS
jgi:uncharacterized protein (UPF0218 family)